MDNQLFLYYQPSDETPVRFSPRLLPVLAIAALGLQTSAAQSETLIPYSQGGGISRSQIESLNRTYARGQSAEAMRSLRQRGEIGSPNYVSEFRDVYNIRGTGNHYQAPQTFTVLYRRSARSNYQGYEAYDWYTN